MTDEIIPLELIEQILKGNCVLFLGIESVLPNSDKELAMELASYCEYHDPNLNLAQVAEYYELSLKRHSLVERVCNWIEKQTYIPFQVDQIIARLPFSTVVMTRTDLLLEEAYRQAGRSVTKIIRDEEVGFGDTQKVLLVKIHGSIDQVDSLVITERDHLSIFKRRPVLSELVKLLYATKTILFIGYNLDDLHAKLLYREIVQEIGKFTRKAYAIWEGASKYSIQYWRNENVDIIDCDSLGFLQALEQKSAIYKAEAERHDKKVKPLELVHSYPYKFLDHFETKDVGLFFGRKEEISVLSRRILAHRLIVLFGSSGVGKTSLIKAGVIPALKEFDIFPIYGRTLDNPIAALEKAISDAVTVETGWPIDSKGLSETSLLNLLMNCQQAIGKRIVLFIDQFEELFRLPYEMQQDFVRQLARCFNEDLRLDVRLVLSLRDDFFTELEGLQEHLPSIYRHVFRPQNLSETAAVEAIVRPLVYFEVKYEDRLVELLIQDLRSEGTIAPAQLQIICSRLYERFAEEKIITVEHYRSLGGARKILGAYLEEVLGRFGVSLRGVARRILQALVSSRKTKELLAGLEIARYLNLKWEQIKQVVSKLEDYRILRKVETEEGHKYELVHEYIVDQVWEWFSEQEARIKEVQELIVTETRYWPKYRTPIGAQKLDAIYEYWNQLILGDLEFELLFRSSIAFGRLRQWNEATESLGDKLIPLYLKLLQDSDLEVIRLATITLARLGAIDELDRVLTHIDWYKQTYARRALRQLEEGRSTEDFAAEISDSKWKEKSLWNVSSVLGIDFGTTSSAIAVMRNEKPTIIPNREGAKFTPSVVAFTNQGEVVVGTPAVLQAATNPERTIFSIKRHLGTDWKIIIDGITYTAVDIAALIFKSLKQDAESYLGKSVSQALVTVPAYFRTQQRYAVRAAAQKAGFETLRMIAEPTAAALAYGLDAQYDRTVAVYDLGGGTFDISLLDLGDRVFEVRAVNGDTSLGGDDFDEKIVNYLIETFRKQHLIDLSSDTVARVRLKEAAERAKVTLSGLETTNIYIPYIYADKNGVKHLDINLDRSKFKELTSELVQKTIACCEKSLIDAKVASRKDDLFIFHPKDDFELVLVGLSTKIPLIKQSVTNLFGVEPRRGVDPDEAVALGAAIQAGVFDAHIRDLLLLDVIPFTLSIETLGRVATPIIERNTTIPTKRSQIFSTDADNQTALQIHIVQGEHPLVTDNENLGQFILEGIPPAPSGIPQIEVTLDIDANSILHITARDKATGKEKTVKLEFDFFQGRYAPIIDETTSEYGESLSVIEPPPAPVFAFPASDKKSEEKEDKPLLKRLTDKISFKKID